VELGRHDITVNAIAPSATEGERGERAMAAQAAASGVTVEAVRQMVRARSPLGRLPTAEDIASLAAFLCSDLARNISGQCIPVTAGEAGG
jgi:NAD(P)-dependent dehydrogenase (short-subunit alcohol dehydrogenase family)